MKITGAVGLNGRVYRAGSEEALQKAADEAGVDLADDRFAGQIEGVQALEDMEKDDLQALADERGMEVKGTGAGGNVLKSDLVKALNG